MRLLLFFIVIMFSTLIACSQNDSGWIILNNGDTVDCAVFSWKNGSLLSKPKVSVDTGDSRVLEYTSYDIREFSKGDSIFWSIPYKPWREGKKKLVFAVLLMKNREHHLLKYENVISSEYGPQYDLKYYYYAGKLFKEEVTGSNYRDIITDYFSDCQYIKDLLSEKKNFFRDDRISNVARSYRVNCGN